MGEGGASLKRGLCGGWNGGSGGEIAGQRVAGAKVMGVNMV